MRRVWRLLGTLLALSAPASWAEDWPTFHRDAERSGVSREAWDISALKVAWRVKVEEESVDASPAVVGDRVYVGGATGAVVCLRAADGEILWRAQTEGAVMSSPAVAAGRVFVGSADRCLYAFQAADGRRLWRLRTRGAIVASPLVLGTRVYCGSMDGTFRCVEAATGRELWRRREAAGISASAASADESLYYGDEAGYIIACRSADGALLWRQQTTGGIIAAPVVAGERLIVPVMSPTTLAPPKIKCLLVLDRQSGQELWAFSGTSSVLHTPVCDEQNVYFAIVSGYLSATELLALRLSDGTEIWKQKLGGVADSSPALVGDKLLFGNHDGQFYVVRKSDGAILQALDLDAKMFSSPAVAGGAIFIGLQGGEVVCLK